MTEHLVTATELHELQQQGTPLVILDTSFRLDKPAWGKEVFLSEHIPGAIYIDLDHDLADFSPNAINGGRHPLPSQAEMRRRVASWGITPATQVIVYDRNKSVFCCRAWWLLRWLGHEQVAVLDGGLKAWKAADLPLAAGEEPTPTPAASPYPERPALVELWTMSQVKENLTEPTTQLVDCRAASRFLGEEEPLDARAGHIPGALNRPFNVNFNPDGTFLPAAELREQISQVSDLPLVAYCGSGVSACPLVLAATIAGLEPPALYGGSFSEWAADYSNEVAVGPATS